MNFVPHVKRKKGGSQKWQVTPFPTCIEGRLYDGVWTGISVEIMEPKDIISIYECGFYGKGSKSRGAPAVVTKHCQEKESETLSLSLEEAFFLAYFVQILRIKNFQNEELHWSQLLVGAEKLNPQFLQHFAGYLYLKSKGWVVKSGIKFGGHFLIYKKGPRFYHASFLVIITIPGDNAVFAIKDLKGLQRIAETSDKDVLFLEVFKPSNFEIKHPTDIAQLTVTETIVRRFNSTAFVQTQNITK